MLFNMAIFKQKINFSVHEGCHPGSMQWGLNESTLIVLQGRLISADEINC